MDIIEKVVLSDGMRQIDSNVVISSRISNENGLFFTETPCIATFVYAYINRLMIIMIIIIRHIFIDNLAKGKPTKQSSTYRGAEASRAVDGNRDPLYKSSSCTHTQRNNKPWWRVDLESEEEVGVVRITNRQESPDRLNRFFIFIGNVDGRISGNTK